MGYSHSLVLLIYVRYRTERVSDSVVQSGEIEPETGILDVTNSDIPQG